MYDILKEYLVSNGYQHIQFINESRDGINQISKKVSFLTKMVDDSIYLIALSDYLKEQEFDKEQYELLVRQVKLFFFHKGYQEVNLLHAIVTNDTSGARELFGLVDTYWIIDEKELRLLIYENQKPDFADAKDLIENVLTGRNKRKSKYFTIMNTVLVAINVLVFVYFEWISSIYSNDQLIEAGSISWQLITEQHEYYRLFTYMFIHFGVSHLLNNMVVLIFIGNYIERAFGSGKYVLLYLCSGVIAGLSSLGYNMINSNNVYSAGASGAVFGIVGAMLFVVVKNKGRFEDIGVRQLILFLFLSLYSGIMSQEVDNVAHIGGLVAGFILAFFLYKRKRIN
ncbi:MAG TPA: rhomboid family intramembrane serine protease [Lachnospiraceae bacterium]|nr:rhomboid family intramembrane serine protease [Lachnospiraceae bacterium]